MEKRDSGKALSARYVRCCSFLNLLVAVGILGILGKSFYLQVVQRSFWEEKGKKQAEISTEIPAYRGSIYDRQGRLLSYSLPQRSLAVSGEPVKDPALLARQLARILGEPEAAIEKKLSQGKHFHWIKRLLTDQEAASVEKLKASGLRFVTEYKRFYPYRQVAGQVLGFVGLDDMGQEGIEKSCNQLLRQEQMTMDQLRDGAQKCLYLGQDAPPESTESSGVKLSIDAFIQYLAETELEKVATYYKAKAAEVVVMDAATSEVLAMANWPFFDPNLSDARKNPDAYRNRSITDSFEPGSTFKVFLMGAALEEGVVKERDRIFCENGRCNLAGHSVKDTHAHGWLTMGEVIKYSSNIGAGKLALQLGCDKYYRYIRSFGFGAPSGIDLPGEVRGLVRPYKRWRPIDLATTGFGQSIGVTALQLTAGLAAVANGGEYLKPVVRREVVDAQGLALEYAKENPPRRVLQKKTATMVRDMMITVTQEGGTGVSAVPEGYSVAGKTGTAQIMDRVTHRYASNKYTSLFTGFVPAENPRLVITVVVHEPQGASYGGVVAGPVFKNVAAKALPYLGIMPGAPAVAPPGVRMVKGKTPVETAKEHGRNVAKASCDPKTLHVAVQKTASGGTGKSVRTVKSGGSPKTVRTAGIPTDAGAKKQAAATAKPATGMKISQSGAGPPKGSGKASGPGAAKAAGKTPIARRTVEPGKYSLQSDHSATKLN